LIKLKFNIARSNRLRILCLGAHSDDIEIGCGGTILQLIKDYKNVEISWYVFSADKEREREAIKSAECFLERAAGKIIVIEHFKDGFFPYIGGQIKKRFEEIKPEINPDIIFTHFRHDLHQDHRLVSELTWNTFRDHLILEYEIPKYDGDLGNPNFYSHLDNLVCKRKIEYILKFFKTQRQNNWFDKETFKAIMHIRGIESNSTSRFAEAFYCGKAVI